MEVKTVIYDEIPEQVEEQLLSELDLANRLLDHEGLGVGEMIYEENIDLEWIAFDKELKNYISQFNQDIIGHPLVIDGTPEINKIKIVRNLIDEQVGYMLDIEPEVWTRARQLPKTCRQYLIISYLNDHMYGGIFAFWNQDYPDSLFIQGITKYLIPSLIKTDALPKLNSLLDPIVESLAKSLGVKTIYVVPLSGQGRILETHYDYQQTDKVVYPCFKIRDASTVLSNPGYRSFYRKVL